MVQIKLKNGSMFQINEIGLRGKLIDSNGSDSGGISVFPLTESDINMLNSKFSIQSIYDEFNGISEEEQTENSASA